MPEYKIWSTSKTGRGSSSIRRSVTRETGSGAFSWLYSANCILSMFLLVSYDQHDSVFNSVYGDLNQFDSPDVRIRPSLLRAHVFLEPKDVSLRFNPNEKVEKHCSMANDLHRYGDAPILPRIRFRVVRCGTHTMARYRQTDRQMKGRKTNDGRRRKLVNLQKETLSPPPRSRA